MNASTNVDVNLVAHIFRGINNVKKTKETGKKIEKIKKSDVASYI